MIDSIKDVQTDQIWTKNVENLFFNDNYQYSNFEMVL